MRRPVIAGNWKMNKTIKEAKHYLIKLDEMVTDDKKDIIICAPFTSLSSISDISKKIKISSQNMNYEDSGAYTGEVSAPMLKEININYTLVGHSERRQYYNEFDSSVNKKVLKALSLNITPIVCIGETLNQKEEGDTKIVVKQQIYHAFKDVKGRQLKDIILAYEPIWAIGTGKSATPKMAGTVITIIREYLKELYEDNSNDIRILYGGSVKPENIKEIMEQEDIDGVLVGGASLNEKTFIKIINYDK